MSGRVTQDGQDKEKLEQDYIRNMSENEKDRMAERIFDDIFLEFINDVVKERTI